MLQGFPEQPDLSAAYADGSGAARPDADIRVGALLRKRRLSKDFTQGDLAKRVGVPADEIEAYESGRVSLPAALLWQLAYALGCPVDCLVGED